MNGGKLNDFFCKLGLSHAFYDRKELSVISVISTWARALSSSSFRELSESFCLHLSSTQSRKMSFVEIVSINKVV